MEKIFTIVSNETKIPLKIVKNVYEMFSQKDTIPFIARYRKERTDGLDEDRLAELENKFTQYSEILKRKEYIKEVILSQNSLTDNLRKRIDNSWDINEIEEIYLPFKPQKSSKILKIKNLGLENLGSEIFKQNRVINIKKELKNYIDNDIAKSEDDVEELLIYLIAQKIFENSNLIKKVRSFYLRNSYIISKLKRGKNREEGKKYYDYFDYEERVEKIPSHRYLAIQRGEKEKFLSISFKIDKDKLIKLIENNVIKSYIAQVTPFIKKGIEYSVDHQIKTHFTTYLKKDLKERSDSEAIDNFSKNLKQLLLAPPLPDIYILGVDPGYRTGGKLAVIDMYGNFIENSVIYPVPPFNKIDQSKKIVDKLIKKYNILAIAIGNGTASREFNNFFKDISKQFDKEISIVIINESGASIYSASKEAKYEFPNLDITVRGAISIARRLQDPLSELIKIDPKSIGVGQYQHDVDQKGLALSLNRVVETIVNRVGVDLNSASYKLLSYVSGLSEKNSKKIVEYRSKLQNGFKNRKEILKIDSIGPKTFEQAAGFLRIMEGDNPLDSTRVHPESYPIVEKIFSNLKISKDQFFNLSEKSKESYLLKLDKKFIEKIDIDNFTYKDIIEELITPSRDPRKSFTYAKFNKDIKEIEDLEVGMILEGVVNNITKFGAFIDIGVHHSGLVHISQISDSFITDIHSILSLNQVVKVKVISIDIERGRVQLSMKDI